MPKPNYAFEKRQRELAKKKQKDEKDARKRDAKGVKPDGTDAPNDAPPADAPR
ncbi:MULTISPECIES: hypothetical protein [unclassified Lysobacter]